MRALVKLFGRSPFAPLRTHMDRVASCIHELPALFEAVNERNGEEIGKLAKKISKLEHDADLTKNDIRGGLKSSLFLPVARVGLLEMLAVQDGLADKAEDIGILLTFRDPAMPPTIAGHFPEFLKKNLEAFKAVFEVINELHELLETGFGGAEADRVREKVDRVAYLEHQVDVIQRELIKALFNSEDTLSYTEFHLWMRVIEETGAISNLAEKLANQVLTTMEMK